MKICKIILVTSVLVASVSCIPEPLSVDDVPQLKPKIVVSSQMGPEQTVIIFLTKSIGALEADEDCDIESLLEQIVINDAQVIISSNSFTDTLIFAGSGLYASISINFA